MTDPINPELDLVIERTTTVSPEKVFAAWTQPDLLVQWFTPAPYQTLEAEIDLRPGGIFRTVMASPEGEVFEAGVGCVLEVIENRRLVWTGALGPDFRPNELGEDDMPFSAIITIEPHEGGTKYSALARHSKAEHAQRHADMGFVDGWGAAFDQLVALMS